VCLYFVRTIERSVTISIDEFREDELQPLQIPPRFVHQSLPDTAMKSFDGVDVDANFFSINCHES